jgi:hypothetical protein
MKIVERKKYKGEGKERCWERDFLVHPLFLCFLFVLCNTARRANLLFLLRAHGPIAIGFIVISRKIYLLNSLRAAT